MEPINLTIIIPTYNRAEILKENIASLLKSNYAFELLIVDDGSKDETEKVVKSFKDSRITYYKHPFNYGYAKSMNEGIKYAKNSQILLLEDDAFIVNPDEFFRTLLSEIDFKKIVATHLLRNGKEVKQTLIERVKRFFAEPLAKEIYLYYGRKRRVVKFCNACFCFNRSEINTRFEESDYVGNAFRIESDFQIRARKEGARIVYNPKLIIDHRRYPSGGHRVNKKNDFLYQCMINHMTFLEKYYSFWNICIYVLLMFLAHPTKWVVIKDALKTYMYMRKSSSNLKLSLLDSR